MQKVISPKFYMQIISLAVIYLLPLIGNSQSIKAVKLYKDGETAPRTANTHCIYNGELYFTSLKSLFKTNGTEAGTILVNTFDNATRFSFYGITVLNNKMIFSLHDSIHGNELWISDGTKAGTKLLIDINPGKGDGVIRPSYISNSILGYQEPIAQMDGFIYFLGDNGNDGVELWKSDGTANGTLMVKNINTVPGEGIIIKPHVPRLVITPNKQIIFRAIDTTYGAEMWVSDGTEAGTHIIKDILPKKYVTIHYPEHLFVFNDKVIFCRAGETFITDGTDSNTHMLIQGGTISSLDYIVDSNKAYFVTTDSLWVTDGSKSGTHYLASVYNHQNNKFAQQYDLGIINGKLYFKGGDNMNNTKNILMLDTTQNNNIRLIASFNSRIINTAFFNNKIYFKSPDSTSSTVQLWESDGTTKGTKYVSHNYQDSIIDLLHINIFIYGNYMQYNNELYFIHHYNDTNGKIGLYKISMWPDGITTSQNLNDDITAYPNPITNNLTLSGKNITHINIYNISGKLVFSHNKKTSKATLNCTNWASGIYLIETTISNGEVHYQKVIKD